MAQTLASDTFYAANYHGQFYLRVAGDFVVLPELKTSQLFISFLSQLLLGSNPSYMIALFTKIKLLSPAHSIPFNRSADCNNYRVKMAHSILNSLLSIQTHCTHSGDPVWLVHAAPRTINDKAELTQVDASSHLYLLWSQLHLGNWHSLMIKPTFELEGAGLQLYACKSEQCHTVNFGIVFPEAKKNQWLLHQIAYRDTENKQVLSVFSSDNLHLTLDALDALDKTISKPETEWEKSKDIRYNGDHQWLFASEEANKLTFSEWLYKSDNLRLLPLEPCKAFQPPHHYQCSSYLIWADHISKTPAIWGKPNPVLSIHSDHGIENYHERYYLFGSNGPVSFLNQYPLLNYWLKATSPSSPFELINQAETVLNSLNLMPFVFQQVSWPVLKSEETTDHYAVTPALQSQLTEHPSPLIENIGTTSPLLITSLPLSGKGGSTASPVKEKQQAGKKTGQGQSALNSGSGKPTRRQHRRSDDDPPPPSNIVIEPSLPSVYPVDIQDLLNTLQTRGFILSSDLATNDWRPLLFNDYPEATETLAQLQDRLSQDLTQFEASESSDKFLKIIKHPSRFNPFDKDHITQLAKAAKSNIAIFTASIPGEHSIQYKMTGKSDAVTRPLTKDFHSFSLTGKTIWLAYAKGHGYYRLLTNRGKPESSGLTRSGQRQPPTPKSDSYITPFTKPITLHRGTAFSPPFSEGLAGLHHAFYGTDRTRDEFSAFKTMIAAVFERENESAEKKSPEEEIIRSSREQLSHVGLIGYPPSTIPNQEPSHFFLTKTAMGFIESLWRSQENLFNTYLSKRTGAQTVSELIIKSVRLRTEYTIGDVDSRGFDNAMINIALPALLQLIKLQSHIIQLLTDITSNVFNSPHITVGVYGGLAIRTHLINDIFHSNINAAIKAGIPTVNDIDFLVPNSAAAEEFIRFITLAISEQFPHLSISKLLLPFESGQPATIKLKITWQDIRVYTIDITTPSASQESDYAQFTKKQISLHEQDIWLPVIALDIALEHLVKGVRQETMKDDSERRRLKSQQILRIILTHSTDPSLIQKVTDMLGPDLQAVINLEDSHSDKSMQLPPEAVFEAVSEEKTSPPIAFTAASTTSDYESGTENEPADSLIHKSTQTVSSQEESLQLKLPSSTIHAQVDVSADTLALKSSKKLKPTEPQTPSLCFAAAEKEIKTSSLLQSAAETLNEKPCISTPSITLLNDQPESLAPPIKEAIKEAASELFQKKSITRKTTQLSKKPIKLKKVRKRSKQQSTHPQKKTDSNFHTSAQKIVEEVLESDANKLTAVTHEKVEDQSLTKPQESTEGNIATNQQEVTTDETQQSAEDDMVTTQQGTAKERPLKKSHKTAKEIATAKQHTAIEGTEQPASKKRKRAKKTKKVTTTLQGKPEETVTPATAVLPTVAQFQVKQSSPVKIKDLTIALPSESSSVKPVPPLVKEVASRQMLPSTFSDSRSFGLTTSNRMMVQWLWLLDNFPNTKTIEGWFFPHLSLDDQGWLQFWKAMKSSGFKLNETKIVIDMETERLPLLNALKHTMILGNPVANYLHSTLVMSVTFTWQDLINLKKSALQFSPSRLLCAEILLDPESNMFDPEGLYQIYAKSQEFSQVDLDITFTNNDTYSVLATEVVRALSMLFPSTGTEPNKEEAIKILLPLLLSTEPVTTEYHPGVLGIFLASGLENHLPSDWQQKSCLNENPYTRWICSWPKDSVLLSPDIKENPVWLARQLEKKETQGETIHFLLSEDVNEELFAATYFSGPAFLNQKLWTALLVEINKKEKISKLSLQQQSKKKSLFRSLALLRSSQIIPYLLFCFKFSGKLYSSDLALACNLINSGIRKEDKVQLKSKIPMLLEWISIPEKQLEKEISMPMLTSPAEIGMSNDILQEHADIAPPFSKIELPDEARLSLSNKLLFQALIMARASYISNDSGLVDVHIREEALTTKPVAIFLKQAAELGNPEACWLAAKVSPDVPLKKALLLRAALHLDYARRSVIKDLYTPSSPLFDIKAVEVIYHHYNKHQKPQRPQRHYVITPNSVADEDNTLDYYLNAAFQKTMRNRKALKALEEKLVTQAEAVSDYSPEAVALSINGQYELLSSDKKNRLSEAHLWLFKKLAPLNEYIKIISKDSNEKSFKRYLNLFIQSPFQLNSYIERNKKVLIITAIDFSLLAASLSIDPKKIPDLTSQLNQLIKNHSITEKSAYLFIINILHSGFFLFNTNLAMQLVDALAEDNQELAELAETAIKYWDSELNTADHQKPENPTQQLPIHTILETPPTKSSTVTTQSLYATDQQVLSSERVTDFGHNPELRCLKPKVKLLLITQILCQQHFAPGCFFDQIWHSLESPPSATDVYSALLPSAAFYLPSLHLLLELTMPAAHSLTLYQFQQLSSVTPSLYPEMEKVANMYTDHRFQDLWNYVDDPDSNQLREAALDPDSLPELLRRERLLVILFTNLERYFTMLSDNDPNIDSLRSDLENYHHSLRAHGYASEAHLAKALLQPFMTEKELTDNFSLDQQILISVSRLRQLKADDIAFECYSLNLISRIETLTKTERGLLSGQVIAWLPGIYRNHELFLALTKTLEKKQLQIVARGMHNAALRWNAEFEIISYLEDVLLNGFLFLIRHFPDDTTAIMEYSEAIAFQLARSRATEPSFEYSLSHWPDKIHESFQGLQDYPSQQLINVLGRLLFMD